MLVKPGAEGLRLLRKLVRDGILVEMLHPLSKEEIEELEYLHLIPDLNKKHRSRFGPIRRPYSMLRVPKSVAEKIHRDFFSS